MEIAIVTGASSGLGEELTYLLDNEKLDVIWLIARSRQVMEKIASQMKTNVEILDFDLTQKESFIIIQKKLHQEKIQVKYLINAAGKGKIGSYKDIDIKDCTDMVDLNCRAAVFLTQLVIPFMKKGSHIMQICSVAAFHPLPYINIYAASKAFLYHYSRALAVELSAEKISVTAVCPYWIKDTSFIETAQKTKNNSYVKNFMFASKKKDVAKKAMQDAKNNKVLSTPGIIATIYHIKTKIIPDSIIMKWWNIFRKFG